MKILWMVFILFFAAFHDIRERKIPNPLILFGLSGICILRYAAEGKKGLFSAGLSCLVIIGAFLPLFLIRAFGAGDIKLFALISAMHGTEEAFQVCVLWFLLAGTVSFGKLLVNHRLHQRKAYLWRYVKSGMRTFAPYYDRKREGKGDVNKDVAITREATIDGEKDTICLAPFLAAAYILFICQKHFIVV